MRSKIVPHLWFDKEAKEAATFYTSLFPNSKITNITRIYDTPSGDCDLVSFELAGQTFKAISAGPLFKFNPSVSFLVCCDNKKEVDTLWKKLSQNGTPLMELAQYPFSEWYGWIQDQYGLSWQVMYMGERPFTQKIIPSLLFVGDVYGKAEEAIHFYAEQFPHSKINEIHRKKEAIEYANFTLANQQFAAMESDYKHDFAFNEAISFMVNCDSQDEIDKYWKALSAVPESEQCGWLKDKYGLSWQIVPSVLEDMMKDPDEEKKARVVQTFLKMKKFDIKKLQNA